MEPRPQRPAANTRRANAHRRDGRAAGKKDTERPLSTMRGSSPEATLQAEYPQPDNRRGLLACASTYSVVNVRSSCAALCNSAIASTIRPMTQERLVRRFKDEAVAVYSIEGAPPAEDFKRYVVSTRDTRDLMNYPEIINTDFTNLMQNGVTNALKGINLLERLSEINSKGVNVYHILRGGLNFKVSDALRKGFGYKWHSSSYLSSQRVLKEGKYEVSDDSYRKFQVPDNATVYTADIVASGASINNGIDYICKYMESSSHRLRNFIFITIGCIEAEKVLAKWHAHFKERMPDYGETMVIYLEGRFGLATDATPFRNKLPFTDLIKSHRQGALLSPEYEHSQFDRTITALEACAIYDGGKKSFEPINHIHDVLEFWEKQREYAETERVPIWDEYNRRFPLDMYFEDLMTLKSGSPEILAEHKRTLWEGVTPEEYARLYHRFGWLWTDERIRTAAEPGSLRTVCDKKIKYLKSLVSDV